MGQRATQPRNLDCYRVTFGDGTSVVADGDHLWTVFDRWSSGGRDWLDGGGWLDESRPAKYHKGKWVTLETRAMAPKAAVGNRGKKEGRYRLPKAAVLDCPDAALPIDPYVLGYWLGDGAKDSSRITVGADDLPSIVAEVEAAGYVVKGLRNQGPNFYFRPDITQRNWDPDGFQARLRMLDVLGNKHIPDCYLRASKAQRIALLQGLMDSDGTVGRAGDAGTSRSCEFSVTDEALATTFTDLVRSLGIRTTMKSSPAKLYGRTVGTRWRLQFVTELPAFRLHRKAALHAEQQTPLRQRDRVIVSMEPVPSVPTRCLSVDSLSSLFLAGDGMVATHNSTALLTMIVLRCMGFGQRQQVIYAAQSRQAARQKWENDFVDILRLESKFQEGRDFNVRIGNGFEQLKFANGSRQSLSALGKASGHGASLDQVIIDEAFSIA